VDASARISRYRAPHCPIAGAMIFHARQVGTTAAMQDLLRDGWTVLSISMPISPILEIAVWLRCPESCCPVQGALGEAAA
jgi:hypothetical protein